jgi:hypothetical protein
LNLIRRLKQLLIIHITIVLLCGCSIDTWKSHEEKEEKFILDGYYINTSSMDGFSLEEPNLYTTYWMVKLYKSFGWKIDNNLYEWISSITIEDVLKNDLGNPSDIVYYYAGLKYELNSKFTNNEKNKILDIVFPKNNIDANLNNIEIFKFLNINIPESQKNTIINSIEQKIDNKPSINVKINYLYFLAMVDPQNELLAKEKLRNITSEVKNQKLNGFVINSLYNEKKLKEQYKLSFFENTSKEAMESLVNSYINFNSGLSPQALFKITYISKDKIGSDSNKKLHRFLEGIKLKNGWFVLNDTLSIFATYYGLLISKHMNELDKVNTKNISNYLNLMAKEIAQKNNFRISDFKNIGYLYKSARLISDSGVKLDFSTLSTKLNKKDYLKLYKKGQIDFIEFMAFLEISEFLNNEKIPLSPSIEKKLKQNLKDTSGLEQAFYISLIKNYFSLGENKFKINYVPLEDDVKIDGIKNSYNLLMELDTANNMDISIEDSKLENVESKILSKIEETSTPANSEEFIGIAILTEALLLLKKGGN